MIKYECIRDLPCNVKSGDIIEMIEGKALNTRTQLFLPFHPKIFLNLYFKIIQ
jgi:hypothetical protein